MAGPRGVCTEPGGSWRPFWIVAGALGLFAVLDLVLPGPDVPPWLWALAAVVPARDPAALPTALLAAVSDASDRRPGREGTLGW